MRSPRTPLPVLSGDPAAGPAGARLPRVRPGSTGCSSAAARSALRPFAARRPFTRGLVLFGGSLLLASLPSPFAHALPAAAHGAPVRGTVGGRSPGYLGIEFHDLSEDQMRSLRPVDHGVEITMVDHDGPAGKAGLRAHDIIMDLNGQAVAGAAALRRMLHDASAGVQIAMTILRGGRPVTITAKLADRNEVARAAMAHLAAAETPVAAPVAPPSMALGFTDRGPLETPVSVSASPQPTEPATPAPGSGFIGHMLHGSIFTGAVLDVMEPQLAGFFGAPQGAGLLVHSVVPDSPAANAGLRAGDVIVRADTYTLHSTTDWTKRLHAAKGRPISLTVLRDRHEVNLSLQQDLKHHSMLEFPGVF